MTSFKSICRCLAQRSKSDERPRLKRLLDINGALLIIIVAAFQFFAAASAAAPVVFYTGHNTNRFGPHSLPGGFPVGDKVQVIAAFDSGDPIGSPTISVEAIQGGTTLALDRVPLGNPMFDPYHVYYKFIDFEPGLIGSWEITPTDTTGVGFSAFTPAIVEPEFLPLVENITVQGTPLGARVTWTLPNLDGFDADAIAVRVIDATSGGHLWESPALSAETTSFTPALDDLQVGVNYVYAIILGDWRGSDVENSSWAFSDPFRFTIPGDMNTDGTVDAADYVVWRKSFSGDQATYDAWQSNFGTSLGPGSGSTLPSAEPLSAAVPEPTIIAVLSTLLLALSFRSRTRSVSK